MAKKSRDQLNAERRAKYKAAREAGLSRSQARSVKRTVKEEPTFAETLSNIFTGIARDIAEGLQDTANDLLKDGSIGKGKGRGGGSGGRDRAPSGGDGKIRGGKGGARKSKSRPSTEKKQLDTGKKIPTFEQFAKRRKGKPANEIIREYRKRGGKIGNEKGKKIIRDVTGKEKQKEKVTRFKYFGNEKNPQKKKYIKDRYMYTVKYAANRTGFVEPSTEYATIASSRKLNKREITDSVYQLVDEMQTMGKEKYKLIDIVEGSVEILYAVDTEK